MASTQTFVTATNQQLQQVVNGTQQDSSPVSSAPSRGSVVVPTTSSTQQVTITVTTPQQLHKQSSVLSSADTHTILQTVPQLPTAIKLQQSQALTQVIQKAATAPQTGPQQQSVQTATIQTSQGPQLIQLTVNSNAQSKDGVEQVTIQAAAPQVGHQSQIYPAQIQYIDVNGKEQTVERMVQTTAGQQSIQTVYPAQIQYVTETTDASLFTNGTSGTTTAYVYADGLYTPTTQATATTAYYNQSNAVIGSAGTIVSNKVGRQVQIAAPTSGQVTAEQLGNSAAGTYVVQTTAVDAEGHPITHTTRASPATVQWLLDNYETAEGVSLPRSTLYNHYLRHCQTHKIDPVNAASFGKLIRSVFLGLRTRRLGTRGNSKYHYYGIRIKPTSPLNQLAEDVAQTTALRQSPLSQNKRFKSATSSTTTQISTSAGKTDVPGGPAGDSFLSPGGTTPGDQHLSAQARQHQQYLGDTSAALPQFCNLDIQTEPLPDTVCNEDVAVFEQIYRDHSEAIVDIIVNLQFSNIETLWQKFWKHPLGMNSEANELAAEWEMKLPKHKLIALIELDTVVAYMRHCDHLLYQSLVEVLIPDVLRPIPSALTQAIRNFAKSLEHWLTNSMKEMPPAIVKTKIATVSAFAQTLRRYTSLNHLAQAARAVLLNASQINQMLADLNRVDFNNVQEQASWVCQCDDAIVHHIQQDFKITLQQQNTLEQWAVWLEGVVSQVLKQYEGKADFSKAARQFLLKWSFYSSMVIRDLTLRSAASFGSFHLIRLLYDEYMFYLIEHRVAAATGQTPIAVMGEYTGLVSESLIPGDDNEGMNMTELTDDEGESVDSMDEQMNVSLQENGTATAHEIVAIHSTTGEIVEVTTSASGLTSSVVQLGTTQLGATVELCN